MSSQFLWATTAQARIKPVSSQFHASSKPAPASTKPVSSQSKASTKVATTRTNASAGVTQQTLDETKIKRSGAGEACACSWQNHMCMQSASLPLISVGRECGECSGLYCDCRAACMSVLDPALVSHFHLTVFCLAALIHCIRARVTFLCGVVSCHDWVDIK